MDFISIVKLWLQHFLLIRHFYRRFFLNPTHRFNTKIEYPYPPLHDETSQLKTHIKLQKISIQPAKI